MKDGATKRMSLWGEVVGASATLRDGGEIKFNDDGALQACPCQPPLLLEDQPRTEAYEDTMLVGEKAAQP